MQAEKTTTYGEMHPKWMIDLVADPAQDGRLQLLFWDGQQPSIHNRLPVRGHDDTPERVYQPPDLEISKAMRFPTQAIPYGSKQDLWEGICAVIKTYTGLTHSHASLLAVSAMASWVGDSTEVPVRLAIEGAPSFERRQLLRLCQCLFRRAVRLADATLSEVCSLPMELRPTLIFERTEPNLQLQKLLRATSSREAQVIAHGRLVNACSPLILCLDEPCDGWFPHWPAIAIPVPDFEGPLPFLDQQTQKQIASEYQGKLLMYRLENYGRVRESNFDVPELSAGSRDMARCLGACLAGNPEMEGLLVRLLREQESQRAPAEQNELNSAVLEALLKFCHEPGKQALTVAEITTELNRVLEKRNETIELKPRSVGACCAVWVLPPSVLMQKAEDSRF